MRSENAFRGYLSAALHQMSGSLQNKRILVLVFSSSRARTHHKDTLKKPVCQV